ncbi:hypothetical protein EJD97_006253 [Solanum chilense]|uniref:EF-hand domain-containing protein n=1 Tax=Solanum chilense TaxID=4083 RepID=A0A6N2CIG5_SOLCI|nr:hypothetical protein EJD97_006253 [Solanum chilense]
MDPTEIRRVFLMFDRNGDGKITRKELSDSLQNMGIYIPEMELKDEEEDTKEAFNVFDQNGDGFITVEELRSVLSSLGLKQGKTLEDCKRMIIKVDVDGDGMVDYKEFRQMMKRGGFASLS